MSANSAPEADLPIVTVGVPVYNAAKYLAGALDSLLAQSLDQFEIVIGDNGSVDGTDKICRRYAAMDRRIRYFRHDANRGAAWNHNFVLGQARGRYFRWHHYDDRCEPTHLERCIAALESNPRAVLAYPRTTIIDGRGSIISAYDDRLALDEETPHARLRHLLQKIYLCNPVLGVIRMEALRRTALHGNYIAADHVLLAELAMQGHFIEVPEALFLRRFHAENSTESNRTNRERAAWFDPRLRKRTWFFPNARLFAERLKAVWRAQIGLHEQILCAGEVVAWQAGFATRDFRKRLSRLPVRIVRRLRVGTGKG